MSPIVILAALAAVILWGASPVAAKVAVADFSPFSVAVLRTFLGGALAVPVALALKVRWPAQRRLQGLLLLSAFCGFVAFPMLFTFGVRLTSANHASMILASLPIFTGAIAMGWDRRPPTRIWILGSLIALAGEVILIGGRTGGGAGQATIAGDALVFLSNGFASLGYVAGGRLQQAGYPSTGTTFWGAAAMALLLAPVVPVLWTQGAFASHPSRPGAPLPISRSSSPSSATCCGTGRWGAAASRASASFSSCSHCPVLYWPPCCCMRRSASASSSRPRWCCWAYGWR